jgi:hypothetical protein
MRSPDPFGGFQYSTVYRTDYGMQGFGIFLCVLAGAAWLTASILFLIWLYQAWNVVPLEYGGPSPGLAAGLRLVPFFNLYWIFRVIPGLSGALQRALKDRDPTYQGGAGFGLGLTACVLGLLGGGVISTILFLIWINLANGAKNQLIWLGRAYNAQPTHWGRY